MSSFVWKYFTKEPGGVAARCGINKCNAILKCAGGSTSSMRSHLERVHKIFDQPKAAETAPSTSKGVQPSTSNAPPAKRQRLISEYSKSRSFEEQISYEVAVTGLTFQAFVKSEMLQEAFQNKFPIKKLPKNGSHVAKIVRGYYEEVKIKTTTMLQTHLKEGKFFSTTLDEWTSTAGRRFLNINLHFIQNEVAKEINLGMVPIHGSATGLKIKELYECRLRDFGLDPEKHIVGTSGDGASAMIKFGEEIASEYVQCNDHGIHLGVTKVLYKSNPKYDADKEGFFVECEDDDETPDEEDDDYADEEDDNEERDEDSLQMTADYQPMIKKMRKIVSFFHRSSVKNEILQKFVKKENNGRELKLKMDSKTRWGSLYDGCERFLKLLGPVKEALSHKEISKSFLWTNTDTNRLEELVEVLYPAKLAVQFLSKKSVNLIECDTTINFLLDQLDEQPHQLSQEVSLAIKEKIMKRRHGVLQSLILYLQDFNNINGSHHFFMAAVPIINNFAVKLMERLFTTEQDDCAELGHGQQEDQPTEQKSIAEKLADAIKSANKTTITQLPAKKVDFKKEMQMYAKTKVRSSVLDRLLEALKTVQATSVAAERRFSEANHLVSKVRNRLGDENINAIGFLKCYFRNKLN